LTGGTIDAFDAFVEHALRGSTGPHVFVGPIVWKPHGQTRRWYFSVVTGDDDGFRADAIDAGDRQTVEAARAAIWVRLMRRPPIVLHDFDDELAMARWTASTWPSARAEALVRDIENERASWAATGPGGRA
jgi:hypothetical protein